MLRTLGTLDAQSDIRAGLRPCARDAPARRSALKGAALSANRAVVCAAWLHDVGYAESVSVTGFHPLDGGRLLQSLGAPMEIVCLVAYHSGAEFEAEQRGLADDLVRASALDPARGCGG